ncbi:monoheme cytochrome C [uncultured Croceitalea sp.]|uniref:monoheme cytochrome C n=1 Tax=uncultured Croceitalea sp. TaxID=1798908 RepID=UPI00330607B4
MDDNLEKHRKQLIRPILLFLVLILLLFGGLFYVKHNPKILQSTETVVTKSFEEGEEEIVDGIHIETGFVEDEHMQLVIQNCTSCHSAKLVTQNHMSEEGWKATIKWMQETQNLWGLGENETKIITYLAKNYGPETKGRRENIEVIEWYELK